MAWNVEAAIVRAVRRTSSAAHIGSSAAARSGCRCSFAVAPDVPAALPPAPNRDALLARTSVAVPDALTAAFTDARAHEPDVFAAHAATFRDRRAADALVSELTAQGFRARWAEVQVDNDQAQQQIFVDGYGTLEDALVLVTRLRSRPSTAGTRLFRQPGAVRRQDLP